MSLRQTQQRANNVAERHEKAIAAEIVRVYREAVKEIRGELSELYERYATNGQLTLAEMTRYNRLTKMERQIVKTMRPHINNNRKLLEKLSEVQYEESFYRTAWSYDNELRVSLGWGQIPHDAVKAAVANPLRATAVKELSQQTLNRVNRAIQQGLIRGLSMRKMMQGVRDAAGISAADAMRIARTEAHRSRELGHLAASQEATDKGVELWRVWDATLDARTRPTHAQLDGTKRRPGKSFPGGAEYPGGFGIASEDINCRCRVVDEIEGYEPQGRRIRYTDEELAKVRARRPDERATSYVRRDYVTFREWARERGITGNRYGQEYNFLRSR